MLGCLNHHVSAEVGNKLYWFVQRVLQSIQNTDQAALPGGSGTSKQPGGNSAANHGNVGAAAAKSSNENSSSSNASSTNPPTEMLVFSNW